MILCSCGIGCNFPIFISWNRTEFIYWGLLPWWIWSNINEFYLSFQRKTALVIDFFCCIFSFFFPLISALIFFISSFYFGFCFSFLVTLGKVVYLRFFLFSEACVIINFPLKTAFAVSHRFLLHYVFICLHVFISSLTFFSDLLVVLVVYCLASMCLFFGSFSVISSLMALWLKIHIC